MKIKSEKVEDFLWVKVSGYRLYTCIVMGHTHLNQETINLRINYNSLSVPSTSNMTRVRIDGIQIAGLMYYHFINLFAVGEQG